MWSEQGAQMIKSTLDFVMCHTHTKMTSELVNENWVSI